MLETLTLDDFTPLLHTEFACTTPDENTYPFVLIEAARTGRPGAEASGGQRQPFSLIFLGPTEPVLPQGIYVLTSASLENLTLFIVPIGKDATGIRYQAIFT